MFGLVTASQIASASVASFLCLGFTYAGGNDAHYGQVTGARATNGATRRGHRLS